LTKKRTYAQRCKIEFLQKDTFTKEVFRLQAVWIESFKKSANMTLTFWAKFVLKVVGTEKLGG
jgi:hypothetical protein